MVRCRVVPGETRTLRAWPIVLGTLLALSSLVPGTVAADSASSIRERASQLSQQNADLAGRSRGALLDLYALDSKLATERTRLVGAPDPNRGDPSRARRGPAGPPRRAALALRLAARARQPAPASLRAGRLGPARRGPRRIVGRRGAERPRLAQPARRPGPPRDRADAERETTAHAHHARVGRTRASAAGPRRPGGPVHPRARTGSGRAFFLPREPGRPAAAHGGRHLLAPAAGSRGGDEIPPDRLGRLRAAHAHVRARPRRQHPHGDGDRIRDQRSHRHRRSHGLGHRRRRSERDPARDAPDHPGLRLGSRRRHGLGGSRRDDRPLVPDRSPRRAPGAGARSRSRCAD